MPRLGILFEDVAAAAAEALAGKSGQIPTIRQVRDHLGSGSLNTIHKHLLEWRKSHVAQADLGPVQIPGSILTAIMDEIRRREEAARADLSAEISRLNTDLAALSNNLTGMEEEKADLEKQNQTLAAEKEQGRGEIDTLKTQLADLAHRLEESRQELTEHRVDRARHELSVSRVQELEAEVKRERAARLEGAAQKALDLDQAPKASAAPSQVEPKVEVSTVESSPQPLQDEADPAPTKPAAKSPKKRVAAKPATAKKK